MTDILHKSPQTICGLDEVGRGALAGPLVACGVIINCSHSQLLSRLPIPPRDSKRLTAIQRQKINQSLDNQLITYHLELITVRDINTLGIAWANQEAFRRIIAKLKAGHYIVDGNINLQLTTKNQKLETLIKADTTILEVMLASIIAKVHRDRLMHQLHPEFPHFNWLNNVGYGTRQHIDALKLHGPCIHHRSLFATTALHNSKSKN